MANSSREVPPGWHRWVDFVTDAVFLRAPSGREHKVTYRDVEEWGWEKCVVMVMLVEAQMCMKGPTTPVAPAALPEEYLRLARAQVDFNQYKAAFGGDPPVLTKPAPKLEEKKPQWDGARKLDLD